MNKDGVSTVSPGQKGEIHRECDTHIYHSYIDCSETADSASMCVCVGLLTF